MAIRKRAQRTLGAVKTVLRRLGVEVTRHPAPPGIPWLLRRVIAAREVDCVLDVGAHEGEFAKTLRKTVGYTGRIISFEPTACSFAKLSSAMGSDPQWEGHRFALGSQQGSANLNVFEGTDFNSFLLPNDLGSQRFSSLRPASSEAVDVHRLDQVVRGASSMVLKVDTQGFDLEVIEGASGVLGSVVAILVELPVQPIYQDAPDIVSMIGRLEELGFLLAGLAPVSRASDGLSVIEFDGLFLRPNQGGRSS